MTVMALDGADGLIHRADMLGAVCGGGLMWCSSRSGKKRRASGPYGLAVSRHGHAHEEGAW